MDVHAVINIIIFIIFQFSLLKFRRKSLDWNIESDIYSVTNSSGLLSRILYCITMTYLLINLFINRLPDDSNPLSLLYLLNILGWIVLTPFIFNDIIDISRGKSISESRYVTSRILMIIVIMSSTKEIATVFPLIYVIFVPILLLLRYFKIDEKYCRDILIYAALINSI